MKPEHFSRHEQYLLTAKLIESAHRSYLEALRAIEEEKDEALPPNQFQQVMWPPIIGGCMALDSLMPKKRRCGVNGFLNRSVVYKP